MLAFWHAFAPSPLLFSIGFFHIYWYGFFIAVAFCVVYFGWKKTMMKLGKNVLRFDSLCFWIVIGGMIGARLYHVVNEYSWYSTRLFEIVAIWHGGLAIHGALIGGLIAGVIVCKKNNLAVSFVFASLVPWLAIGQAIGRWGNYFNQELYGQPSQLPWAIFIDSAHRMQGFEHSAYYHPVFFYESLLLLILGYVLLKRVVRLKDAMPASDVIVYYFLVTGMIRAVMELLRIDAVPLVIGIRLPLFVSISVVIVCVVVLFLKRSKRVVEYIRALLAP
ncbi:MAG: Prolipoprotein diacylglyceryl transferase [Parcubacteria group bacterium GW2011_GWA2_43_13]|nr:MAG: Prolipoprotein diacylglyceryl transferase [Parcubacteria group bacterium GW2011_GWA2_43_13]OGY68569.1 MAG: prolipoprotein diacylglyceryl transferase [Candidatus Jacksonbacteria bacterium RIFCSPHIGHO2_02_FULL_43_10]OGY70565.1 MAG: prolipoprotein diacylglyceryl transferase [Candidatus Jacksonbacteria bacterium RIFCSPLOWO2_01_FULL_44_13]HAZ16341.1 prolipoprotein diacylglyceryl transferase [Candidatus Jacksonbacteria bacterium]